MKVPRQALAAQARELVNNLVEAIDELTQPTEGSVIHSFDRAIPDNWVSVRKDVRYTVTTPELDRDTVVTTATIEVRGHKYVGIAEHRLPLIASASNAPKFVWRTSPIEKASVMGKYDKLVPTQAGLLVLDDLAAKWASVVDESSQKACDLLRTEAVALARVATEIAPLVEACDHARQAWQVLGA